MSHQNILQFENLFSFLSLAQAVFKDWTIGGRRLYWDRDYASQ